MSKLDALLERMAALVGISPDYTDAFGQSVETSPTTRQALLAGLGLDISSEAGAQESLARLERLKKGPLPAVITVDAETPTTIEFRASPGQQAWILIEEDGAVHEGRFGKGDLGLALPALPAGYHRFRAGDRETTVIAAPPRCWEPEALQGESRLWGATAQIYSLRSERDFGIGDYSDVALFAEEVGRLGGAFLGLSPVHALFASDRSKISPYSPSSRLFLEPLYVDPTCVAGFAESGARRLLEDPDMQERLARLRSAPLIDYAAVWAIKRPLLDALWRHFQSSDAHPAFEAFRRAGGEALEAHATFEALFEHLREQGRFWVGEWPEEYRSVHSVAVRRFRLDHAERVAFHVWLQWLADSARSGGRAGPCRRPAHRPLPGPCRRRRRWRV
jgi:(1->4)-alpha-D-glucan 1-alpha-D-glucosylmutase